MRTKVIHDGLVSIGDDELRVELGPARKQVECTEETLRATGRKVPGDRVRLGNGRETVVKVVHDALGRPVEMGKKMTVLDRDRAKRVWYLYRKEIRPDADGNDVEAFVEKGTHRGPRDEAVAACIAKFGKES